MALRSDLGDRVVTKCKIRVLGGALTYGLEVILRAGKLGSTVVNVVSLSLCSVQGWDRIGNSRVVDCLRRSKT